MNIIQNQIMVIATYFPSRKDSQNFTLVTFRVIFICF